MADVPFSRFELTPEAALAESATGQPELPEILGRYTLVEQIGRGGMAEIFLAREETELGATRFAAVKRILPIFADDSRFSEMLIREAKLAARLSHKCIVQVFDLGRHAARGGKGDERLFIAMEYVEGFDLATLLRRATERRIGVPVDVSLRIVGDVLEGLAHAHRLRGDDGQPLGIVHRDVSPSNVLISRDGEVKLCDFGIAHANMLVHDDDNETLKGKAGYMSPEHARGEEVDARADVFAAGIVLWELLSGRRLYRAREGVSTLEQARRAEIPPLGGLDVPRFEQLDRIVQRALTVGKEERYPSAEAFARDLEEYVADAGLVTTPFRLRAWLADHFGDDPASRGERPPERAAPAPSPELAGSQESSSTPGVHLPRVSLVPVSRGAMRAFKEQLAAHVALEEELAERDEEAETEAIDVILEEAREGAPVPGKPRKPYAVFAACVVAATLVAVVWALVR